MSILVITMSNDGDCVDRVVQHVEKLREEAVRLDTDLFPTEIPMISRYGNGKDDETTLALPRGLVDLNQVTAIWNRRSNIGDKIPASLGEQIREASMGESEATMEGMLAALDVFELDPAQNVARARHKELQMRVARSLGLEIPRTLTTNVPDEARAFAESCGWDVVAKVLSPFIIEEEGVEKVVYTTKIDSRHAAQFDGLRLCPMTFQENVAKAMELRVTVVGRQVFAASIDSQTLDHARIDWRRANDELLKKWRRHELPAEISGKLFRFLDYFGLNYGAMDVIVTPEGRHVFLEVNPIGQYGWIEEATGYPMSQAIAEGLVDPLSRRVPGRAGLTLGYDLAFANH
jgi:glutathione synthase/RimK-type ligase-like ATP-grasp enzyme